MTADWVRLMLVRDLRASLFSFMCYSTHHRLLDDHQLEHRREDPTRQLVTFIASYGDLYVTLVNPVVVRVDVPDVTVLRFEQLWPGADTVARDVALRSLCAALPPTMVCDAAGALNAAYALKSLTRMNPSAHRSTYWSAEVDRWFRGELGEQQMRLGCH